MNYLFVNFSDERLEDPVRFVQDAACFHEGVYEHRNLRIGAIETRTFSCRDCKATLFVKEVNEEKEVSCDIYHDPVFYFFQTKSGKLSLLTELTKNWKNHAENHDA